MLQEKEEKIDKNKKVKDNRCLLTQELKALRSEVKGEHSAGIEFQILAVSTVDKDMLITGRNGDRKIMQSTRTMDGPPIT